MLDFFRRTASVSTHRIFSLPILVLMPHSGCNCRCVMCDIWKANHEKQEISIEELERHLQSFRSLGVKRVALSGGEALMHSNLWVFCDLLHAIGAKISLLSTGITLAHHAQDVVTHCDDLIISLDGSPEIHNKIRNIPGAFEKLESGVKAIKRLNGRFRVTGRTVLQKQNFRDLPGVIRTARAMGLDQISFLGADVSSEAFNRPEPWSKERISEVSLTDEETFELERIIQQSFVDFRDEYDMKFIAENRTKMMEIVKQYRASNQTADFPTKKCNAPWVSAVIESNGDVLPCFFHKAYGNLRSGSFEEIVNEKKAVAFRKKLDPKSNRICQQCVCSLYVPLARSVY